MCVIYETNFDFIGYEVTAALNIKCAVFSVVTPYI
jgi:hypothetical protein